MITILTALVLAFSPTPGPVVPSPNMPPVCPGYSTPVCPDFNGPQPGIVCENGYCERVY